MGLWLAFYNWFIKKQYSTFVLGTLGFISILNANFVSPFIWQSEKPGQLSFLSELLSHCICFMKLLPHLSAYSFYASTYGIEIFNCFH